MKYPDANQAITIKSFVGIVPLLSCVIVKCSNNTKTRNFYNKLCNVSDNQFVSLICLMLETHYSDVILVD